MCCSMAWLSSAEPVRGHRGRLLLVLIGRPVALGQLGQVQRLRRRRGQRDLAGVGQRRRELQRLGLLAQPGQHVQDERRPGLDLDVALGHVAPDRDEVRPGRDHRPRQDRPGRRQHRRPAGPLLPVDLHGRRVAEREHRGVEAVEGLRDVVHRHRGQPRVHPARAVVEEEPDELQRAGLAQAAAVAGRLLDGDGRLEQVERRVVAHAVDLLVAGVPGDLLHHREPRLLGRAEVVRVAGQQGPEAGPLGRRPGGPRLGLRWACLRCHDVPP
jgi:hypothetical protein